MSEKVAATSYILNFYRDVVLLTHYVATYVNVLLEIQFKFGDVDLEKMDMEEKNIIIGNVQNLRYYVNKCKVEYVSLHKKLHFDDVDNKAILELHARMNAPETGEALFMILRKDAEAYAEHMNSVIVSDVIQHVLETNEDLMQSLYGEETTQTTPRPA